MQAYLDLMRRILLEGVESDDRTGVGTYSLFAPQLRVDLAQGFPLLTTKKVFFRGIVVELLWFLAGRTDNQWLNERNVHIWDEWATAEKTAKFCRHEGDLGPVYGWQWRRFGGDYDHRDATKPGFDQIAWLVNEIKTKPNSRRLIVTGWNPEQADKVELPPCHTLFQFYVRGGKLSCQLYQRSADYFLGVPFNIASYALLTHMLAQVCGLKVGELVTTYGDCHLYKNHAEQVGTLLARQPRALPTLWINPEVKDIFSFTESDFRVDGYNPEPAISAPIAV